MYNLSGHPFTIETLQDYYKALDCHTFDEASLIQTLSQLQTTSTDTETQTPEHTIVASDIRAFTQALIDSFIPKDTHAYPLLTVVAWINSDNETVNQMAIELWVQHFRLLFAEEEHPLALLSTFPEQCATPIQMSAVLSVLTEKEIDIHELLSSGLLQDYATSNINNLPGVEKTYKRVFSDDDERLNLISRVPLSGRAVDTGTISTRVISGILRRDAFEPYQVDIHQPRFAWASVTKERLSTLIQRIGLEVMIRALSVLASQQHVPLSQHVEAILAENTDAELAYLLRYISTHVSAEDNLRSHCLTQISERISDERALSLLRSSDVSPWVLLAAKPTLIGQLTESDLEKITQPLTAPSYEASRPFIAPHDIKAAFDVASDTDCDATLSDNIYLTIAKIYLETTEELALEGYIFEALKSSETVQQWIQEKATPLKTQWDEILQANVPTLLIEESYSYQNILDVAQSIRQPIRRLQKLGLKDTPVPLNVHDQDALILFKSIEHYPSIDYTDESLQAHIESILSLMQPIDKYYREPPPVHRTQDDEQNNLKLAAQEAARERLKRALKKEAEEHVALAKARLVFMTACLEKKGICCQLLLDTEKPYKAYIPKLITPDNLIRAYAIFTDAQLSDFLQYTQLQLTDVITNGTQLGGALQYLNETQQNALLQRLPNDLSRIITNGAQLNYALQDLNETQCHLLLDRLPSDLSEIITNGYQLNYALQDLNETQQNALLQRLPNDLSRIITDGAQLNYALQDLNETQQNALLQRLPNDLSRIITDGFQLGCALEDLNETQRGTLLQKLPNNLSKIITSGIQLGRALQHLSETQRDALLQRLPNDLSSMMTDSIQLSHALQDLNETQRDALLQRIPVNLSRIITDGIQLGRALQHLNDTQRETILGRLPADLTGIITDGNQLGRALQYLNDAQCNSLLNKLADRLTRIITCGVQLGRALQYLNETQCHALLQRLPGMITNGFQLGCALQYLNDAQRDIVLARLPSDLSSIMTDGEQLGCALRYLNDAQRDIILARLPSDLSSIMTDGLDLSYALRYLNETQQNALLEGMKGYLPTLLPNGFIGRKHRHLVNQKINEVRRYNGFFFARASHIHIGSLEDKLTKYVDDRENGCSFHWCFIKVMSSTNWLCTHSDRMTDRGTKCMAARQVLSMFQEDSEQRPEMPDVQYRHALTEGLLGDIIRGAGSLETILASAQEKWDASNCSP